MTLPQPAQLKQQARQQLAPRLPLAKQLILLHTAAVLALNLILMVLSHLLDRGMNASGGLSGIQTHSMLATAQLTLQLALLVIVPFFMIGWRYVCLLFSRGQLPGKEHFLEGFRRFLPFLRLMLLKGLLFVALIFVGVYAAYFLIMLSPLSTPMLEAMMAAADEEAVYEAVMQGMARLQLPLILTGGALSIALCAPFFYRFRLAEFALMEDPSGSALGALRTSRDHMRGNAMAMVRLDLSFWWFWVLDVLVTAVAYADVLLPAVGIALPFSPTVCFFLSFLLYAPCQLLLYRCCKVTVDTTYATAYLTLTQPSPKDLQMLCKTDAFTQ